MQPLSTCLDVFLVLQKIYKRSTRRGRRTRRFNESVKTMGPKPWISLENRGKMLALSEEGYFSQWGDCCLSRL